MQVTCLPTYCCLQQQYVGRHDTRIHYSDSTSSLQQQYVSRHVTRIHYSDSTSSLQQQYVGRHDTRLKLVLSE
jgi:hypothetical protein